MTTTTTKGATATDGCPALGRRAGAKAVPRRRRSNQPMRGTNATPRVGHRLRRLHRSLRSVSPYLCLWVLLRLPQLLVVLPHSLITPSSAFSALSTLSTAILAFQQIMLQGTEGVHEVFDFGRIMASTITTGAGSCGTADKHHHIRREHAGISTAPASLSSSLYVQQRRLHAQRQELRLGKRVDALSSNTRSRRGRGRQGGREEGSGAVLLGLHNSLVLPCSPHLLEQHLLHRQPLHHVRQVVLHRMHACTRPGAHIEHAEASLALAHVPPASDTPSTSSSSAMLHGNSFASLQLLLAVAVAIGGASRGAETRDRDIVFP